MTGDLLPAAPAARHNQYPSLSSRAVRDGGVPRAHPRTLFASRACATLPACVSRASERDKTFARPTARQALPAPLVVQEVARPGDLYDEGSLAERRSPWRNTGALSAAALRSLCRTTDRAHGRVCCAAAPSCPTPHRAVIPTPAGHSRGAQPAHAAGSELSPRTGPQLCLARALCTS